MSVSRTPRLAKACQTLCRSSVLIASIGCALVVSVAARASAADAVSGTVVDQNGRPLARAAVRALDRAGAETAAVFADESGRFLLEITAGDGCHITVSLTGFQPSDTSCAADRAARIVLKVAPIEETVVVTATRTEAPAGQVGSSVSVFTADDIERRQKPPVADLLRSTPGAMVVRSGGTGGVTSLFVRGGESSYNKVLLDGIPLNEPGGTFNFSNLTSEGLERIEMVRGAQSALFGSDAMSSVVQLFTSRGDRSGGRPRVSAAFEGGTYASGRTDLLVSGGTARTDYAIGAAYLTTDNRVPNNTFENTTILANVGASLTDTATIFHRPRRAQHSGTPGATACGASRSRCLLRASRRRRRRQLRPSSSPRRFGSGRRTP